MPAARRLKLPVPVVIVTGALASGKTTVLGGILRSKPQDEVWAVLINEFGAAGLDAALLAGGAAPLSGAGPAAADSSGLEGVHIKQLAGGCLCCALSNVTSLAIAQLLRSVKPDRCAAAERQGQSWFAGKPPVPSDVLSCCLPSLQAVHRALWPGPPSHASGHAAGGAPGAVAGAAARGVPGEAEQLGRVTAGRPALHCLLAGFAS